MAIASRMSTSIDADRRRVTVIIPNWNGMIWLDDCLQSLARQSFSEFRTIVVDNGSTDDSIVFIARNYPDVEIVALSANTGFANAANIGFEKSASPYVVLLNTDTRAHPDWLSSLVERIEIEPKEVAAINSQLLRTDDPERIDDAGDELSWYGAAVKRGHNDPAADYQELTEIFSPCAAACLYRRDFLLQTGGFDTSFFAYLEDVDLGLRGRLLGYRYLYLPKAKILHKGHGSFLPRGHYVEIITRNRLLLFAKNIPLRLLLRHAAELACGQIYFMVAYARPCSSLRGYMALIFELRCLVTKRRKILKETRLSLAEIDALLNRRTPWPPLQALATSIMSRLRLGPAR